VKTGEEQKEKETKMSTNTNLTIDSANSTALPVSANQPIKKEVNTMKQSFYIVFGGIALGWITCMVILISFMLQS